MADEIIVETTSTQVIEVSSPGPQGPAGAAGTGLETLTTQGDTLYRGASAGERLPIGTTGQILRVSAGGTPEWANESGAVSSVAGKTGVVTLDKNDVGLGNVTNAAQVTSVTGTAPIVSSGGTTPAISISAATTSAAGSMSSADKTKLDGIAAGAEVNVQANWTESNSASDAFILNKPTLGTAAAASTSDFAAASHTHPASAISDSTTAGRALLTGVDAAAQRTTLGLGTAATSATGDFAAASHSHGNINSSGQVGSDSGRVLVTTTAGAVTTLALGTANQILRVNSGASGVEFADPAVSGVTGAASSASDVLGVSGANITGVDANADRIIFWDDSASALKHLTVGSGLSISDTTISATASGGSKTYAVFTAEHNQPPSTAFATLDTRNSIAVLDFDAATDENAVFVGIVPEAAVLTSGLIVRLHWMATTATSGNVRWGVQFERSNTDLDADSFDTAVEATAATNGTSGIITTTAITVTTIDGITAGDVFRLKVFRNADDATNDTMTGDAELVAVEIRSAA